MRKSLSRCIGTPVQRFVRRRTKGSPPLIGETAPGVPRDVTAWISHFPEWPILSNPLAHRGIQPLLEAPFEFARTRPKIYHCIVSTFCCGIDIYTASHL